MKKRRSTTPGNKSASKRTRPTSRTRHTASPIADNPQATSRPLVARPTAGQHDSAFRIESNRNRSIAIGAFVVLFGLLSIYFYVGILSTLHNYYTLILVIPLYGYVFGDLALWWRSGVRALAIDSSGLNIVRTSRLPERRIDRHEIKNIRISTSFDGKSADLILHGGSSRKVLWMYLYSGPHVRITQGSFLKGEFDEFLQRLAALAPASS